jgi:hypothetical protein
VVTVAAVTEGHGFAKPENRLKFYAAATERFLARTSPAGRFCA